VKWDDDQRARPEKLRPGQRRCRRCGRAFYPLRYQKSDLCALDRMLQRRRLTTKRQRRWRRKRRQLSEAYDVAMRAQRWR